MPRNPAIAAFVANQRNYNTQIGASIDGIVADVGSLNAKIEALQNTPPVLDPADQALLDEIQAEGQALADRVKAADDLTPPEVPTDVGGGEG